MKRLLAVVVFLGALSVPGCATRAYTHYRYAPDGTVAESWRVTLFDNAIKDNATGIHLTLGDGLSLEVGSMTRQPDPATVAAAAFVAQSLASQAALFAKLMMMMP